MTYKPKKFKPKTCKVCGKLFTPKGPTSVFCSAECRAEAEKARDRERYARNHPNSKPGKARVHAEKDRARREAADKRLSTKAGDSPTHYARNQVADSIEKFARIDLGDGEERHMKEAPAEVLAEKDEEPEEGIDVSLFMERFRSIVDEQRTKTAFADKTGLTRQNTEAIYNQERLPRVNTIMKICTRCGISADWLLGLSEDKGLRAENKELKAENERLTEMIAELNRSKTSKTLEILKAVMDVMGVEA